MLLHLSEILIDYESLTLHNLDTFWLERIGLIVVDAKSADVCLRAGDLLELRRSDGSRLETEVAAIPRVRPNYPDKPFSFSLPRGVGKSDVPIGTEVWVVE